MIQRLPDQVLGDLPVPGDLPNQDLPNQDLPNQDLPNQDLPNQDLPIQDLPDQGELPEKEHQGILHVRGQMTQIMVGGRSIIHSTTMIITTTITGSINVRLRRTKTIQN